MADLPTGTVTFLFTDIEGSTRLWEEHPTTMRQALARHDALLRAAIESHGGHVFKTVGDAFDAVFSDPAAAVATAVAIQQAAQAERWPIPAGLAVRIALHTGTAEERDGDYFGPAVNRIARLLAAGHGEQILLSEGTRVLVEEGLPAEVSIRDLGQHRLKDLAHPERISQLLVRGLRGEFPSLRSLDVRPNNLPRQLTSFVGRTTELAEVKRLLEHTALVTLTGSGGAGKTRLALQVAAELVESFADGVWLAELTPLADPALVMQTVAAALSVRESGPGASLVQSLEHALKPKALLLVLDNCEHVLAACAELVQIILQRCPHVRVLATSQEALGVPGEGVYRVPSLSLPDPGRAHAPEQLSQFESVRLFMERAAAARSGFILTEANAAAVARICSQLDGIPLAIELAAARVKVLSVEEITARLSDRFALLTAGGRTAPARHQTLRAALDWSYDLLTEKERLLLRRLSVFAGGWTLPAAEAVCADEKCATQDVLDVLTRLVDRSLVLVGELDGGETWYRLLETVRLYAREKLLGTEEEPAIRRRHRDWYLRFTEEAQPQLQGPALEGWLRRLEAEHDNIRAALEWCATAEPDPAYSLRLTGAMWHFWEVRGYLTEGRGWLEGALARQPAPAIPARVQALNGAAYLAVAQGNFDRAVTLGQESLDLARRLGDKRGVATCLNVLGLHACRLEKFDQAAQMGEESLALSREVGDRRGVAGAQVILGLVARGQGDFARAAALLEEGLAQVRAVGDKWLAAMTLTNLALVYREMGDLTRAGAVMEETLAAFQELGDRYGTAFSLANLGILAWNEQRYTQAAGLFVESLQLRKELDDRRGISTSLTGLAAVAAALGRAEAAAVLFGAAEALRETLKVPPPPFIRNAYERQIAAVREALGTDPFEAAWQRGRAMSVEDALGYVASEPIAAPVADQS